MTIDERTRHQLYLRLEAALGTEEATTLMEHLPPVGWADVATKHDLDTRPGALEERLELRFEMIDLRFSETTSALRAEFHRDLRLNTMAIIGANTAILTVLLSAQLALFHLLSR